MNFEKIDASCHERKGKEGQTSETAGKFFNYRIEGLLNGIKDAAATGIYYVYQSLYIYIFLYVYIFG